MGLPGQQYFAGTHFNPNVTWWAEVRRRSSPTSTAASACSSRACSWPTPATTTATTCRTSPSSSASDPARVLPGYDYDVVTEEVAPRRAWRCKDGRLVLPDGMSYRVLVLPRPHGDLAAGAAQGEGTGRRRRDGHRPEAGRGQRPDGLPAAATRRWRSWRTNCGATTADGQRARSARPRHLRPDRPRGAAGRRREAGLRVHRRRRRDRRSTTSIAATATTDIYFVANRDQPLPSA